MGSPQTPLDPATHRQVATAVHGWVLDGIAERSPWRLEDVVFQGGTSLALAYGSPRFSEDLDFVASWGLELGKVMKKVAAHVEEGLQQQFPGAQVELKEKVREDNPNAVYFFSVALPNTLGKVKVKTEFWRVDPELVKGYDGTYVQLAGRGHIRPMAPVASLEQVFVDKMIALGGRERIKWRDLFDLWFMDTLAHNSPSPLLEDAPKAAAQMAATMQLYSLSADDLAKGWQAILDRPRQELIDLAQTDLQPWVPEQLWKRLWPKEVEKMVDGCRDKLALALALQPLLAPLSEALMEKRRAAQPESEAAPNPVGRQP